MNDVSIHAFRGEGDHQTTCSLPHPQKFQSTPSGGKATSRRRNREPCQRAFQSTPSGGKATRANNTEIRLEPVSIHAFRGEGDGVRAYRDGLRAVSIHAFRGKGDQMEWEVAPGAALFQSTPSGGKATQNFVSASSSETFQSTPSGGKATQRGAYTLRRDCRFNPRLPGGRRLSYERNRFHRHRFQSTPSGGEGDEYTTTDAGCQERFNPRLPGGRRHPKLKTLKDANAFQSTPSGGKATMVGDCRGG